MAYSYLSKFRSSIPASQGQYILQDLRRKMEKGSIRNLDEFRDKLKQLTTDLLEQRIKPTLKVYLASIEEDLSSEYFNDMLQKIEDDLFTALQEATTLEELLAVHHNLIQRTALQVVRFGVNKLQGKLKGQEFLRHTTYGFSNIFLNTFDQPQTRSYEDADLEVFLKKDPRTGEFIDEGDYAHLAQVGELLTGSLYEERQAVFKSVELRGNTNSTNTEIDAAFSTSAPENMIDGQNDTFWAIPVLRRTPAPGGVIVELQFNLSVPQMLTYVEVDPAADGSMRLVSISIVDDNNLSTAIAAPDVQLVGPTLVNFRPVIARSLILQLRQDNYVEMQFKQNDRNKTFYQALNGEKEVPLVIEDMRSPLEKAITSSFILEDGFELGTTALHEELHYWQYVLALDNVRAGFRTYQNTSFFVSEKQEVKDLGLLGLGVIEKRPERNVGSAEITYTEHKYLPFSPTEEYKFYHGSIEYWLIGRFYDENQEVISTDLIPIFPIGAHRVYHERLVLTQRLGGNILSNDSGALMFFTNPEPGDVWVYKNQKRLSYGTDWTFVSAASSSGLTVESSNTGKRMQRGIQLLSTPTLSDIFTVSYTPLASSCPTVPYSSTLLKVVDLVGDEQVRMLKDNLIVFGETRLAHKVSKVVFYLMVVLRRNSSNIYVSPLLEEFALASSVRDKSKFANSYV